MTVQNGQLPSGLVGWPFVNFRKEECGEAAREEPQTIPQQLAESRNNADDCAGCLQRRQIWSENATRAFVREVGKEAQNANEEDKSQCNPPVTTIGHHSLFLRSPMLREESLAVAAVDGELHRRAFLERVDAMCNCEIGDPSQFQPALRCGLGVSA
jgi:hypothetical protein